MIVDPGKPLVIHHSRGDGDAILTRVFSSGAIALDPPGLLLELSAIYGPAAAEES